MCICSNALFLDVVGLSPCYRYIVVLKLILPAAQFHIAYPTPLNMLEYYKLAGKIFAKVLLEVTQ